MVLQDDIREYIDLDNEIKRLLIQSKKLRKQREEVIYRITTALDKKGLPGFKYNDMAVLLVKKNTRARKKESAKKDDLSNVLHTQRDKPPEELVDDIMEVLKGDMTEKLSIKIQHRKK